MSIVERTRSDPGFSNRIVTGHVARTAWELAWPTAVGMLLQTITNNIDRYFVAKLGGAQVAGMGLSQNILMLVFGAVVAISAATTAMVARFVGAGTWDDARQAARQSLYFAFLASGVIMLVAYPTARAFIGLMAGDAREVIRPAAQYLSISLIGLVPLFATTIMIAALRGLGDMVTPVKLTLTGAVLAAVLDWILIFGNLGFPEMGLRGAAVASVASRVVAAILGIVYVVRSPLRDSVARFQRMSNSWLRRIVNLGVPAGLQAILRTGASMVYFSFLGRVEDGQAAMAALTIGLGVEALAYSPGFAFSQAAAAMVGQNLGAGSPDRARSAGWACAAQSFAVMTVMAMVFFVFARPIVLWFTVDPDIVRLTVLYLQVNALSEPFIALGMTFSGALQGAGDTRSPTIVTFATLWLLRIPLTYYLAISLEHGAVAAWWTMSGSAIASGLLMTVVFAMGRWRHIRI